MDRVKAINAAEEYCRHNGLSEDRLTEQYKQVIQGKLYFAQKRSDVVVSGLCNDLETQPLPTLVVDGNYVVSPTQYTEQYLRA